MKNDNVIGIIGAGISGLSLAQFLIQDGFQVKIFEKYQPGKSFKL